MSRPSTRHLYSSTPVNYLPIFETSTHRLVPTFRSKNFRRSMSPGRSGIELNQSEVMTKGVDTRQLTKEGSTWMSEL